MSELLLATVEETHKAATRREGVSLMTPVGLVEGEVLVYLDRHEDATLRQLNRELQWPAYMVMMAVGSLIRAGLIRGVQRDLEVILKNRKPLYES